MSATAGTFNFQQTLMDDDANMSPNVTTETKPAESGVSAADIHRPSAPFWSWFIKEYGINRTPRSIYSIVRNDYGNAHKILNIFETKDVSCFNANATFKDDTSESENDDEECFSPATPTLEQVVSVTVSYENWHRGYKRVEESTELQNKRACVYRREQASIRMEVGDHIPRNIGTEQIYRQIKYEKKSRAFPTSFYPVHASLTLMKYSNLEKYLDCTNSDADSHLEDESLDIDNDEFMHDSFSTRTSNHIENLMQYEQGNPESKHEKRKNLSSSEASIGRHLKFSDTEDGDDVPIMVSVATPLKNPKLMRTSRGELMCSYEDQDTDREALRLCRRVCCFLPSACTCYHLLACEYTHLFSCRLVVSWCGKLH
ncbi:hypothetical protein B566_EDAN015494 [Ephemera danica]|nr:hypothetical protein B566_EDAN015494 [Ephemera danica]